MMISTSIQKNNFGALRLLFAYLVIFAHATLPPIELVYGGLKLSIEPSFFGKLAVDAFFLISGYLIFKSFFQSKSNITYLKKRVLRIYPGFIVASIFCVFIIAPLTAGWMLISSFNHLDWLKIILNAFSLYQVTVDGAFPKFGDLPLNAPMWTIKFEFICYLLLPILGFLLKDRKQYFAFFVLLCLFLITTILLDFHGAPRGAHSFLHKFARLTSAFMTGGLFYLFAEDIKWNKWLTLLCFILIIISQLNKYSADLGLIIFGSYLLFNFALNYKSKFLATVGSKNDISYGVYLYAWPIQWLLVHCFSSIPIWLNLCCTLIFSSIIGYISWVYIEKPFISLKKNLSN